MIFDGEKKFIYERSSCYESHRPRGQYRSEYENKKILLDTGASALFVENAKAMDIPLENIDFGILSHAHYDHANGMEYFFKRNRHAKFYLQKSCAENCYAYEEGHFRYIGIPKDLLTAYQDRLIYADGDAALCDGVYVVAHKRKNREKIGEREQMYQKKNGAFLPDNFDHEQSLVFETEKDSSSSVPVPTPARRTSSGKFQKPSPEKRFSP